MRRTILALQASVVVLAGALLVAPLPATFVERYYAGWLYPALQSALTPWSNTSGLALFDVLILAVGLLALVVWVRSVRHAWRRRSPRPLASAALVTLIVASTLYVWFALAWGLNYSRSALEARVGFDRSRITAARLRQLAERSLAEVNRLHAAAHAAGFPERGKMPPSLVRALHEVEQQLGRPRPTTPGRPKRTLFAPFFQTAGVDGMHAPFLLETLVNPALTPPERPVVLAHEWAHLSGYAPEAEASFVGLLAALRADAPSRYSAWLALFDHAVADLPRDERRAFIARLAPGPAADRRAIAERLQARIEVVAQASWATYDQYLKAQGVREGIESYGRVVELLLGTGALDWS